MPKRYFKEVQRSKSGGRSGILNTRTGWVKTPFFMPVATKGAVVGLEPAQVAATGAQVLLANTYHLHMQPGEKVIKKLGGLQAFTGWKGPMLTDSGGFQVFSLANVRKITEEGVTFKDPKSGREVLITPEKSMQIQSDLGADIIMAFDDLTGLDPAKTKVRTDEAVERTHRWLVRCIAEFKKLTKNLLETEQPLLFGIAQGGLDKKLRAKSLEFVQSQEVDGLGIGGLSVGESKNDMHGMLKFLGKLYDPTKIRYLMGVGEPSNMRYAIEHGIDMFDCVLPTRNARHGSLWITGDKRLNLNNARHAADPGPIDNKCDCSTCKMGYSRAYLYQLFKTDNPLGGSLASTHNLRYLARLCEEYQ
jgi:queuine tRNA-ribosyltransferase